MKNDKKEQSFEEKLMIIQDIVQSLEDGNLSLDEMVRSYETAMKLSVECKKFLESAEMRIETITKEYDKTLENK